MGMSSSQARLLNLTTRMHQIEYRAAKIEAEKLQLANKSRQVYLEYQNAMEQTKIQGKTLNQDASTGFVDLNLRVLEDSYSYGLAKTLHLQEINSGKLYITRKIADKYHLDGSGVVGSEYEFITNAGLNGTIAGFSAVTNSVPTATYTGVPTVVGDTEVTREIPVIDPAIGYQEISDIDRVIPGDTISISNVSSFEQGKTYSISNLDELKKLQTLVNTNRVSTQGVNFVLTNNIYMDSTTWAGIGTTANAFKGNFDGNGFTIANLKGSKGLFGYVTGNYNKNEEEKYGCIKNIQLTNLQITGNTQKIGGLIGYNVGGCAENVSVQGSVKNTSTNSTNASWVGGLIGENLNGIVRNASANVNVQTNKGHCVGGLIGHDTGGTISHCKSTGTVTADYYVGGLIGHEYNRGSGTIDSCVSYPTSVTATSTNATYKKTAGAFIGAIDSTASGSISNSTYVSYENKPAVGLGNNVTEDGNQVVEEGAVNTFYTTNIYLPSANSIKSNIYYALDKAGKDADSNFDENLDRWMSELYREDSNFEGVLVESALKVASINDYINAYLQNGSYSDIVDLIIQDINNFTTSSTSKYQDHYVPSREYEYSAYDGGNNDMAEKTISLTTGSFNNIAGNLFTAFKNAGFNISDANEAGNIKKWLEEKYDTNSETDKHKLAELNKYITNTDDNSEIANIYNAYTNNESYALPADKQTYKADKYNISLTNQEQNILWENMTPELEEALDFYDLIKDGYIIVEDEQAKDKEWFVNMINYGVAILIEKDHIKKEKYETSVATNTMLQEVEDTTNLRKAEAKYEADMRRIDMKDRKYDYDLAAIENERNAIKQEMETLKTVIKDNVERTFKLFG